MNGVSMHKWWLLLAFVALPAFGAAPNFSLKDLSGKQHNVNEYIGKGKWTVVTVWSHNCPICRAEMYHMVFFHDEHKNKNATVLGVSIDGWEDRQKAKQFVDDQAASFPNLIGDVDDMERFGAGPLVGTPTYYVFDPKGKLAAKKVGAATQQQFEEFIARHPQGAPAKPGRLE